MMSGLPDRAPWTPRRWMGMIGLAMVFQLVAIIALSDRTPPRMPQAGYRPFIALMPGQPPGVPPDALGDPAMFALVNPRVFSGAAWLNAASLEHRLIDWQEPPKWLTPEVPGLGREFISFTSTNTASPFRVEYKSIPQVAEVSPEGQPLVTRTTIRMEGALATLKLAQQPEPPSIPASDLLQPSVVEVAVDSEGAVVSARLVSGGGPKSAEQKSADRRALELARQVQFEPPDGVRGPDLVWGRLIFRWHTVEPVAAPAATTPPRP